MTRFILRRLLLSVPTLFGVLVVAFLLLYVAPGDPVESMVYSASRANVRRVFTAGREVALDDSEVLKEVRRVVQKLL